MLLRHGETALSGERRFAGRGDIPLTATGLEQAAAAAARLAARGGLDLIVSSPLERARRTADAVAAATGVPVVVGDGWMETDFGEWEGLSHAEAERALARADGRLAQRHRRRAAGRRELRRHLRPGAHGAGLAAGRAGRGHACSSSVTSRR